MNQVAIEHEELVKTFGKQPEVKTEETAATTEVKTEEKTEEVTAAVVETKTEEQTTTATDENTEEVEDTEDQNIDTFLNEQLGEVTKTAEAVKTAEVKTEEKTKEVSQDERSQVADELLQDPLLAWAMQQKALGKNPAEELAALFKEDPNTLSEETLFERMLDAEGIKGEDATEELERFREKSPLDKKLTVKSFRQELVNQRASKMELLKPEAFVDNSSEILQAAQNRLTAIRTEREGKAFDGMELTKERMDAIYEYVSTKAPAILKADGTFDVDEMFDYAVWKLHKKDVIKSNMTKFVNEAKKKVVEERNRTSGGTNVQKGHVKGSSNTLDDAITAMR